MRFKVKKFLYPCGANDERKEMNLIIDEHFADAEINRHLVLAQMDKGKPISTPIYYLCILFIFEMQILFITQSSTLSENSNCEKSARTFA